MLYSALIVFIYHVAILSRTVVSRETLDQFKRIGTYLDMKSENTISHINGG